MAKLTTTLFALLCCALPLFSQKIHTITFRNYPVLANVDSLEKAVVSHKNNPEQYLLGLVTLERSREQLSSNKFGQYLPQIDSLSRQQNLPNIQAAYLVMEADHINYDGHERLKSLQYVNKALELFQQQQDTTGMIRCYLILRRLNIDDITHATGSKEMANQYLKRLLTLTDESNWPGDKLVALFERQSYYYQFFTKKADSLIILTRQALKIIDANPELSYQKPGQLNYLAIAYGFKGNHREALRIYLACLRLTPDQWYSSKMTYNRNIGSAYYVMNDFTNAETYFKESVRLGELHKLAASIQIVSIFSLAIAQYSGHKYERACVNFMKADSLKSLMQDELRTKDFLELQTKYETEKKDQANLALQKEKQSYKLGIFISIALLSIISLLLFYLYRKNKQLDEYAHFRDQIFAIISHDLRSPVLALEGLSKQGSFLMKRGQMESLELVSQKIDTSILQLNGLLNNLLAWAISQNTRPDNKLERLPLLPVVHEIVLLYADITSAKEIAINVDIPPDLAVWANKNGLAVIIRNLVDNAVKNTASKKITLTAGQEKNSIILRVINNDVIVSEEVVLKIQNYLKGIRSNYLQTASGLGLQLVAYFTQKYNGSVTMNSTAQEGTVFTVVLPA